MKKYLLSAVALFACIALSSQSKGEKYVAASVSSSFGNDKIERYDGYVTSNGSSPLTTSINAKGEFGYFVFDNVRLALALGVPYSSSPLSQSGDTWLKQNIIGFQINPNVAYYVRLADNLFYTPEIGFDYELGSVREDVTTSISVNSEYNGWAVYANILAIELRVSQKLAIGAGIGAVSYSNGKYTQKGSEAYLKDNQFRFDFNNSAVHIRLYF